MAEEIKVGTVTWVKLSPDADGTLVLRLVEKADEGVAMTLDPVVYELNRSHVLFSTMESTFFSALLHGFDLAITAEGSRVVAASIAGRQLPLETPSELRQRVAAGPTQEALGALARGFKSTTKRAARWRRRSSVSINLNTGPLDRGALRTPARRAKRHWTRKSPVRRALFFGYRNSSASVSTKQAPPSIPIRAARQRSGRVGRPGEPRMGRLKLSFDDQGSEFPGVKYCGQTAI